MKVPLLDLTAQYASIKSEIDRAVSDVFASQQFILGGTVRECEKRLASYIGVEHAIAVSSGTDAILMSLMDLKIGPGDEVITTPFTFFATVGAISRVGATPTFVDILPSDYNIDVSRLEEKITRRTKAIMPVHLYGQMADMNAINEIASKHGLAVIEDAAQAIGARRDKNSAGTVSDYGCFSFFPSKNLGAAGDAGLVVTNDEERARRLRLLRGHGAEKKYYHRIVGGNFRIDAIQAAVISAKLPHLDGWTRARQENAKRYESLFDEGGINVAKTNTYQREEAWRDGGAEIYLPEVVAERHVFNQYIIRVGNRGELKAHLDDEEIGNEVYYPVPLHLQECFQHLGYASGDFPESEAAAAETLALPVYAELQTEQARSVVKSVSEAIIQDNTRASDRQQTFVAS